MALAPCRNRVWKPGSSARPACRVFTATSRPSTVSVARQTSPMPPAAMRSSSRYRSPRTCPGRGIGSSLPIRRGAEISGPAYLLPAQPVTGQRGEGGGEQDGVHELAADDLLQGQRPQRAQALPVEAEGEDGGQRLHDEHRQPADDRDLP